MAAMGRFYQLPGEVGFAQGRVDEDFVNESSTRFSAVAPA
jgi:hypothetical protein